MIERLLLRDRAGPTLLGWGLVAPVFVIEPPSKIEGRILDGAAEIVRSSREGSALTTPGASSVSQNTSMGDGSWGEGGGGLGKVQGGDGGGVGSGGGTRCSEEEQPRRCKVPRDVRKVRPILPVSQHLCVFVVSLPLS